MARPERTAEDQRLIDEWLSKNKVTVLAPNARTDANEIRSLWGKKKKAGRPKKESNV
jgi:hypothetical protein